MQLASELRPRSLHWNAGRGLSLCMARSEEYNKAIRVLGRGFVCKAKARLLIDHSFDSKVMKDERAGRPVDALHAVVLRAQSWGFSTSGVERTFPSGG